MGLDGLAGQETPGASAASQQAEPRRAIDGGCKPLKCAATGLVPTVEGVAGLTLTLHMVGHRASGVAQDLQTQLLAGLGGLWVVNAQAREVVRWHTSIATNRL